MSHHNTQTPARGDVATALQQNPATAVRKGPQTRKIKLRVTEELIEVRAVEIVVPRSLDLSDPDALRAAVQESYIDGNYRALDGGCSSIDVISREYSAEPMPTASTRSEPSDQSNATAQEAA